MSHHLLPSLVTCSDAINSLSIIKWFIQMYWTSFYTNWCSSKCGEDEYKQKQTKLLLMLKSFQKRNSRYQVISFMMIELFLSFKSSSKFKHWREMTFSFTWAGYNGRQSYRRSYEKKIQFTVFLRCTAHVCNLGRRYSSISDQLLVHSYQIMHKQENCQFCQVEPNSIQIQSWSKANKVSPNKIKLLSFQFLN